MIGLENLSVGYHPGKPVLQDLNLAARKGEMVALVGRNGSGKSTLLKSLLGIQAPLQGECLLLDRSISTYGSRERARMISYVSASASATPGLRVKEVLSLGRIPHGDWTGRLSAEEKELIGRIAEELGLLAFMDRPLEELSDGERQRALIGRSLVQDTPVILLDEPAAFLDIPHKYELAGILSALRDQGKTILYSTHDLEMAMMTADRFWVILEGSAREGAPEDLGLQGSFDELFRDNSILFDAHSGRFRMQREARGHIALSGAEGPVRAWTGHALRRLGFEISGEEAQFPSLQWRGEGEECIWHYREAKGMEVRKFEKLYDLAVFLTMEQ